MSAALDRVRRRRELVDAGATDAQLEAFDREEHGDPIETGPATGTERRQMRARASKAEAPTKEAYRAGRKEGRASARRPAAQRRRARSAPPSSPVRLIEPSARQATGGAKVVGMALWTVALYLVLQSAPQLTGFLGGVGKALSWLESPTAAVPRKGESVGGAGVGTGITEGVNRAADATKKIFGSTTAATGAGNLRPGAPSPSTA